MTTGPDAVFTTVADAAAFTELGGPLAVVKSQIPAGGRGKGKFKGKETEGGNPASRHANHNHGPGSAQGNNQGGEQSQRRE